MKRVLHIMPVSKPRMTQSDKWKKRAITTKYWGYKDELREASIILPESYHLHFILPVSASWSAKKKAAHIGKPHTNKPDKDNLEKGFLDALYKDDSGVWTGQVSKWWGEKGAIIIEEIPTPVFPLETNENLM